jgi:hypothetical protein
MSIQKKLTTKEIAQLIEILSTRFEKNIQRHKNIIWEKVIQRLELADQGKIWSLNEMEKTGGEPDVVNIDKKSGAIVFFDCAAESPSGRRSICYDREGLDSRKEFKPANTAFDMAAEMGIEILNEEEYRFLQQLGKFDSKTSSWILTPPSIRKLGGALFADYRFGHVFVYHNGAQSYYGGRGFRGKLII